MWFLSLILCLGVAVTGVLAKSNSRWKPVALGLSLLMFISIAFQFVNTGGNGKGVDYSTRWDESVGYMLAQALTRDGMDNGTVLILDAQIEGAKYPLDEIHFAAFQSGLPAGHALHLVKLDATELNPLQEFTQDDIPEEMVPKQYIDLSLPLLMQAIKAEENVAALVSFVGLPEDMSGEALANLPPVYVYGLEQFTTDHADEDLLRLPSIRAIVRRKPGSGLKLKPASEDLEKVFAERFILKQ